MPILTTSNTLLVDAWDPQEAINGGIPWLQTNKVIVEKPMTLFKGHVKPHTPNEKPQERVQNWESYKQRVIIESGDGTKHVSTDEIAS